jgi:hypothetical protein
VKDIVINAVKGVKPVAVEAEAETSKNKSEEMLQELRRIRQAVEK